MQLGNIFEDKLFAWKVLKEVSGRNYRSYVNENDRSEIETMWELEK